MALALLDRKATLTPAEHLARVADPTLLFQDAGLSEPHEHQIKALRNWRRDHYLLWTRQGGKSTCGGVLGVHHLLFPDGDYIPTIAIASRAQRQSGELFRTVRRTYGRLSYAPPLITDSATALELPSGARVLAFPGSEETVRSISAVTLLLIDEGTLVGADLKGAITPMLATTDGPVWAMGTARGCSGWFYDDWINPDVQAVKSKVTCHDVPHIRPEYIAREKRSMPSWEFNREYLCEFADEGEETLITAAIIDAARDPKVHALW